MGRTKGGSTPRYIQPWMRRILATEATRADCSLACALIAGLVAEHLIAYKGSDSDVIVEQARHQGMQPVIPPRKNRKAQREYDKHLYRQRHRVENAFLLLKQWRGIATRYAKRLSSFLAGTQILCLVLWLPIW